MQRLLKWGQKAVGILLGHIILCCFVPLATFAVVVDWFCWTHPAGNWAEGLLQYCAGILLAVISLAMTAGVLVGLGLAIAEIGWGPLVWPEITASWRKAKED